MVGTAPGRLVDLTYTVRVAGGGVRVGEVTVADDGLSWSGTADLREISNATVGLFEVTADAQTEAGDCSGVTYVCIEGRNPVTTAAGAGATALGAGGLLLLGLSLARAGRLGAARAGIQGFAGGATAGVGGAALLQQFCVLPLTAASAAGVPVALGFAGAVGASLLRPVGSRGAREVSRRMRGRAEMPGRPAEGEVTTRLEGAADRGRELVDASRGTGAPEASAGPSPPGGPSPAPGGPAAPGGPSPAPGAAGGPSPAPGVVPPAEGGAVIPPIVPPPPDERVTCPSCGTENDRDNEYCTNCGTGLRT